ncbi:MAG TPA: kelch repeat-containing protein [Planctomycetota bacterium]|nr:kelch repeat-containing protein [Planctomycetota bacterium]
MRRFAVSLIVCLGCAPGAVRAQSLQLDVVGGSMPGALDLDTYPGLYPFELVMIVPSTLPGPTPINLFDPLDPRSLDIGLDLLGFAWVGFTGVDLHMRVSTSLAAAPALQDQALYFQSVTFLWLPTLLHRLSNANAIRLGTANTFRDRAVGFLDDRAFASVLPRADRRWMVVGGGRGQLLAQVAHATSEIYDPITDGFSPGPMMTTRRSLHTATELQDGRWLIVGGVNYNNDPQPSCEIYDPVLDTFTATGTMATPRMGHTATLLADGRVFVTGGLAALTVTPTQLSAVHDATNTTEIYDPAAGTWSPGPNLLTPRAGHVAITRPNGKILLAGGISWDTVIIVGWLPAVRRSCDLYDPVANTMVAGPQMVTARSMIDPLALGNDRWLLAGGISSLTLTNLGTPTAAAEIYDAVANTWTAVGPMATPRGNHKGWALGNGQFLLAGGANGNILSPVPLSSTEVFSLSTNTFGAGPPMNIERAGAAMFLTPQGQVQLFGGATAGGMISQTTEWYYR